MPWSMQNPPRPAKNWPDDRKRACVLAANAALRAGKSDEEAIQACLGAAKNVEKSTQQRVVDLFKADKVLAGQPVRLLPFMEGGYFRGGVLKPPITPDVGAKLLANFENRATSGAYQTNVPVNIEHDEVAGKIGVLASLLLEADGVYGVLDLTEKGRDLLEAGAFDYLSPEIVWDLEDTRTGESIGPAMVGLAVTNYPFFGDAVAMYSREAGEHADMNDPADDDSANGEGDRRLYALIRRAVESVFGEHRQANMEVEDMPEGQTNGNGDTLGGQPPEDFSARIAEQQAQLAEQQAQLEQFRRQAEEQRGVIEAQRGQIEELATSRLRERFNRQVESLGHIGADRDQLVDNLLWLHEQDSTEGRAHFSFFSALLSTVEQALAESPAFQEVGRAGTSRGTGSAFSRFAALVDEVAAQQNLVVTEGDANWGRLAIGVAEEHPELYEEYMRQRS